ncbi:type II secretion system F family protein [Paenibacillus assamensis]|uniref:type II secretion system F family protein n=1 Tax=Paenibacillus assamensis TaxID=311244 RepID=UPI0003F4DD73|nr:type II secretion system F family protein [Paenibacillus assamensis]
MLGQWLWFAAFAMMLVIFIAGHMQARGNHYEIISQVDPSYKLVMWLPFALHLTGKFQRILDTHLIFVSLRQAIFQLHGPQAFYVRYRLFVGEAMLIVYIGTMAALLLPAVTDGSAINFVGAWMLALILPLVKSKELMNKSVQKQQDIQMELPELLSKLSLLVQAGETVQKALAICVQRKGEHLNHPLYMELNRMLKDVQNGYSFAQALEQFSKRCAVQEAAMFTTTILMNQKRGGASFVLAMEDLGRQLWDKRKAVARKRGEEASTKLIFPMMLMFLVVLAVVGGPALMMMG